MTGIIVPCPWCGSTDISWSIPAYSRNVRPYCVECEAQGPSTIAPSRTDQAAVNAAAIEAWNGGRQ